MASIVYNRAKSEFLKANIDWLDDTIKVLLVDADYVPNPDHNFVSSVSSEELSGTGYTGGFAGSGRKTLANKTVTQDDTNDRAAATADPSTWTAINAGTAAYAIVYKSVSSDADSPLIACIDIANVTFNGTDYTINWQSAANGGIVYI